MTKKVSPQCFKGRSQSSDLGFKQAHQWLLKFWRMQACSGSV